MLDDFLVENREAIISRARARVGSRVSPRASDLELANGIPLFLTQLGNALQLAKSSVQIDHEDLTRSAGRHGNDLLHMGLTIAQVVHDYGDVCQVITELAIEQSSSIPPEDFRTLNLCLDDAIAHAVTEYANQRERKIEHDGTERLGALAHELRNLVDASMLSFEMIQSGHVAVSGSTGVLHARNLMGIRELVDRSLADVRLDTGRQHIELLSVAEMIEELEIASLMQANARGLRFLVTSVDRTVTIKGDRQTLVAAISNLLQNAFKFTHKDSQIALTVRVTADRVFFDVEDECGGLPPGMAERLFLAEPDGNGEPPVLGLGLSICRKAARSNGAVLSVQDMPGKGCVFTLDLPRSAPPLALVLGSWCFSSIPARSRGAGMLSYWSSLRFPRRDLAWSRRKPSSFLGWTLLS